MSDVRAVPATWTAAVQDVLRDVCARVPERPGLADDLERYLLNGENEAVLAELPLHQNMRTWLSNSRTNGYTAPAALVYPQFDAAPVAVRLRWAKMLVACVDEKQRDSTFSFRPKGGAHWPGALLMHSVRANPLVWDDARGPGRQAVGPSKPGAASFEEMLVADGLDAWSLWAAALSAGPALEFSARMVAVVDGYSDALARHADPLRPLLLAGNADERLHAVALLERTQDEVVAKFAVEIAELATSSSKKVRAAVEGLVRRTRTAIAAPLQQIATNGKAEARRLAARLLETTIAARVLHEVDAAPGRSGERPPASVDWSGAVTPVVAQQLAELKRAYDEVVERDNAWSRNFHAEELRAGRNHSLHQSAPLPDSDLRDLRDWIASADPTGTPVRANSRHANVRRVLPFLRCMAAQPGVPFVALLKTLAYFDLLCDGRTLGYGAIVTIDAAYRAHGRPSLLELADALADMQQVDARLLVEACCMRTGGLARTWRSEDVAPFFARHADVLVPYVGSVEPVSSSFDRGALYAAIATLNDPPAALVEALFDRALGAAKTEREPAQDALAGYADRDTRIAAALASGPAEARAAAAQWIGRLRIESALPALEKAVAREKLDAAKGAMLDALQALGQPVEKYLDRAALAKEAAKGLAKGVPAELDWFAWDALPDVHWNDTGKPVDRDTLRWLLVQATKQKSPEPNAVLRKYCGMFEPRDREALGQFVLDAWIAQDTKTIPHAEAVQQATQRARDGHAFMAANPQVYTTGYLRHENHLLGLTEEQLAARHLRHLTSTPIGTAIGSKGLLAIAAACAAERAAAPVAKYLKAWHGSRAAQGRALVAMLAWVEHPNAAQLTLSISHRFRTKSIQEEAERQAEALAERKGWTLDELADRTIPSAGFDETGTLELSYGERAFVGKLGADNKVALFDDAGTALKALSEPRQDDDAELAKEAKREYAGAKKDVKTVVDLQAGRLYEALCTQRDWAFADWDTYLNGHPIVRKLVQRVVWIAVEDGRTTTFRPLDDGTLTNANDESVSPVTDARVRVAHDSNVPAGDVAKWQQHLVDYQVQPLFRQFGRAVYTPQDPTRVDVRDFEGHLIDAFALRNRALKLGYARAASEDGGWFYAYEKRFPALGLTGVINFTGNALPETSRTVALLDLSFVGGDDAAQRPQVVLGDVPPVLLSECYADLRTIAGEGTGFDPDWKTRT